MALSVSIYLLLIKLILSNSNDPKIALPQIGFIIIFLQKHKTKDFMTWDIKSYLIIIKNPIRLISSLTCP